MSERTEGYVVRSSCWTSEMRYFAGGASYSEMVDGAVMGLMQAVSIFDALRGGHYDAKIARVRRVQGKARWVPLEEDIRIVDRNGHVLWASGREESHAEKVVPGESRWEVVDDE